MVVLGCVVTEPSDFASTWGLAPKHDPWMVMVSVLMEAAESVDTAVIVGGRHPDGPPPEVVSLSVLTSDAPESVVVEMTVMATTRRMIIGTPTVAECPS